MAMVKKIGAFFKKEKRPSNIPSSFSKIEPSSVVEEVQEMTEPQSEITPPPPYYIPENKNICPREPSWRNSVINLCGIMQRWVQNILASKYFLRKNITMLLIGTCGIGLTCIPLSCWIWIATSAKSFIQMEYFLPFLAFCTTMSFCPMLSTPKNSSDLWCAHCDNGRSSTWVKDFDFTVPFITIGFFTSRVLLNVFFSYHIPLLTIIGFSEMYLYRTMCCSYYDHRNHVYDHRPWVFFGQIMIVIMNILALGYFLFHPYIAINVVSK